MCTLRDFSMRWCIVGHLSFYMQFVLHECDIFLNLSLHSSRPAAERWCYLSINVVLLIFHNNNRSTTTVVSNISIVLLQTVSNIKLLLCRMCQRVWQRSCPYWMILCKKKSFAHFISSLWILRTIFTFFFRFDFDHAQIQFSCVYVLMAEKRITNHINSTYSFPKFLFSFSHPAFYVTSLHIGNILHNLLVFDFTSKIFRRKSYIKKFKKNTAFITFTHPHALYTTILSWEQCQIQRTKKNTPKHQLSIGFENPNIRVVFFNSHCFTYSYDKRINWNSRNSTCEGMRTNEDSVMWNILIASESFT